MNTDERRAKDLLTSGSLRLILDAASVPRATIDVLLRWLEEGASFSMRPRAWRAASRFVTPTRVCGHLHATREVAERCARRMAKRYGEAYAAEEVSP